MDQTKEFDVLIIGAGPAGVGTGMALLDIGVENFMILERNTIGASFLGWPEEMKFITPSFTGQGFGMLDLNAAVPNTSPAYSFRKEHVSGKEYAKYLQAVAQHFNIPVKEKVTVLQIEKMETGFSVRTSEGVYKSRFIIWAAGEFQYPFLTPFPGAEYCIHNSRVKCWKEIQGEHTIVIGGYESGMDAAFHLIQSGKKVTVLSKDNVWEDEATDPSLALSPYTFERMQRALRTGRLMLLANAEVKSIERRNDEYIIYVPEGAPLRSRQKPILAAGFQGGVHMIREHFNWLTDREVELTEKDESVKSEGLFLVGPQVKHQQVIFCFIYKFRQRFMIVAEEIAKRLEIEIDPDVIASYRNSNMYLDDLSCCDVKCDC